MDTVLGAVGDLLGYKMIDHEFGFYLSTEGCKIGAVGARDAVCPDNPYGGAVLGVKAGSNSPATGVQDNILTNP